MIHKSTLITYSERNTIDAILKETLNNIDQKFILRILTGNNYSPPSFNYQHYQIVGLPKICLKFFLKYKIGLYDKLYPNINIFGHSYRIGHFKNFPTISGETIK